MKKSHSPINNIYASKPINKEAAVVVGAGTHYEPEKKILVIESELPLKTMRITSSMLNSMGFVNLTGFVFGRFTVIGLSCEKRTPPLWVVRCLCGRYSTRRAKAIKNPKNTWDCCEHCRNLLFLKRNEFYRRTGESKSYGYFFEGK